MNSCNYLNEFTRSFPLCQLIHTPQTTFSWPKSICIHDPRPKLDHRVLTFWSIARDGGWKGSAPLAVIPLTGSFEHVLDEPNGSGCAYVWKDWTTELVKIRTRNVIRKIPSFNWLLLHVLNEANLSKLITIIWLEFDIIICYSIFIDWILHFFNLYQSKFYHGIVLRYNYSTIYAKWFTV
jgi:hypothetical protein